MLELTEELVMLESPSRHKVLLDKFAEHLISTLEKRFNFLPEKVFNGPEGNVLRYIFNKEGKDQVLIVCHYDTVFPEGTIHEIPFRVDGDRAFGPGVFDMKAGIVQVLYALHYKLSKGELKSRVCLLLTPDEEVGSKFSKKIIEEAAARSKFAIITEPPLEGKLKTSRKGICDLKIHVKGKSVHAALDPEKGINAITEAVDYLNLIDEQSEIFRNKLMVNPGVIRGGTRPNVVPDQCDLEIDIRYTEEKDLENLIETLRKKKHVKEGTKVEFNMDVRPPMKRDEKTIKIFSELKKNATNQGLILEETEASGASDGNLCSLFCPVLDGMGAIGEGAHSKEEFVLIKKMPERATLISLALDL